MSGAASLKVFPGAEYEPLPGVSREGLAPIVKAYSRLILVDGLVL